MHKCNTDIHSAKILPSKENKTLETVTAVTIPCPYSVIQHKHWLLRIETASSGTFSGNNF